MYPEICKIGPLTIYSYGLMLAMAFFVSSTLACLQAKRENLNPESVFNFTFTVFVFGIIGARIFYVFNFIAYYLKNPLEIIMLQHGGLSWFGGLLAGSLAAIYFLKSKKLQVYRFLDLIVPFLALAQAIGRIGCLLNGCCFGRMSGFGIYFPAHDAVLVPTQLYSSLALIALFIFLRFLQERPHRQGQIFFTYLLLYALKRFLIEFLRADSPRILFGLTLFQFLSIFVFCLALANLFLIKKTR